MRLVRDGLQSGDWQCALRNTVPRSAVVLGLPGGREARVVARAFRGESVRVALRDPAGGPELVADVPPAEAPALDARTTVSLRDPRS